MKRYASLGWLYTVIAITGFTVCIVIWPRNFFLAGNAWHWIHQFLFYSSISLLVIGSALVARGKGYSLGFGFLGILGPAGWAILFALEDRITEITAPPGNGSACREKKTS